MNWGFGIVQVASDCSRIDGTMTASWKVFIEDLRVSLRISVFSEYFPHNKRYLLFPPLSLTPSSSEIEANCLWISSACCSSDKTRFCGSSESVFFVRILARSKWRAWILPTIVSSCSSTALCNVLAFAAEQAHYLILSLSFPLVLSIFLSFCLSLRRPATRTGFPPNSSWCALLTNCFVRIWTASSQVR